MPGSLRVLYNILAVPRIALYLTETLDVVPGIWWSFSASSGVTASITTGTILDFTFHICSSCFFSPWYFSLLLCFFFLMVLSPGIATSITTALFCSLSSTTMTGSLARRYLLVWTLKSRRIFALFVLNLFYRFVPLGLWNFKSILCPDVPVYDSTHSVMLFTIHCPSLHLFV